MSKIYYDGIGDISTKAYKLVISSFHENLMEQVTMYMNEGWVCQGGIAVASENTGYDPDMGRETSETYYYQAMILK